MKYFTILFILFFSSCSLENANFNEDNTIVDDNKTSDINARKAPGYNITCTNSTQQYNYEAVFNWTNPSSIPFFEGNAFIEIEPISSGTNYPIVQIPIHYYSNGSKIIEHASLNSMGDVVLLQSGIIQIHAKEFNYRYAIYDTESPNFVSSSWKYHNLIH